ncbi:hypothetical protein YTPLAS18_20600 [Nitrospira sp.]|nr:hypothetical protein YTPLAS18_20600 [Nitrospira sp.]
MARPLKKRVFDESAENVLARLTSVVSDPLPQQTVTLRLLLEALLRRIANRNPKEALFLRGHIRSIASVEKEFVLPSDERERLISIVGREMVQIGDDLYESYMTEILPVLCSAPVPKGAHGSDTLVFQRTWLTSFLQSHPVSGRARYNEYYAWLKRHRKTIHRTLSAIPCFCAYRNSLDGITDDDLLERTGPAQLIDIILAELHRSTPAAIRKVLSHSKEL